MAKQKNRNRIFFTVVVIVLVLVVAGFGYGVFKFKDISSYFSGLGLPKVSGVILFFGEGCPQCVKVDTFIKNNGVLQKVAFTQLEVFHSAENVKLLAEKAKACGLNIQSIGVPFLWDGTKCVIGYIDIIKFFQGKISAQKTK